MRRALWLAALLLACATCAFRAGEKSGLSESIEREREITADIHRQIRNLAPLVSDPIVLDYLYEVGQRIVAVTEPQPFIYRFSLIRDPALNAFTIGGGYVYIHTGTLAQVGDVDELAGLLAHEIAHVRKRHVARAGEGQNAATLLTLASMAAVALGADPTVLAIAQGINVSLQLKHTRAHEGEADREGIGYLLKAGYDPYGMQRFFQRIVAENPARGMGSQIPTYLYSHPAVTERIANIEPLVERSGVMARGPRTEDPRLAQIQARLAKLSRPVAGGSGLRARAEFERELSDPWLARASDTQTDERAIELLNQAELAEPNDPRIYLRRAEIHERNGRLNQARADLEKAFALDPHTPLVQYSLGMLHTRLGNRSRAVFYLEQAVAHYSPGSAPRRRAELEIERLEFPVLETSELHRLGAAAATGSGSTDAPPRFRLGDTIVWSGQLSERFTKLKPVLIVRWRSPIGGVEKEQKLRADGKGMLTASFESRGAEPGAWALEVVIGDSTEQTLPFELTATSAGRG